MSQNNNREAAASRLTKLNIEDLRTIIFILYGILIFIAVVRSLGPVVDTIKALQVCKF